MSKLPNSGPITKLARMIREGHERMLERRLERRRTVVRWLLKYPPIPLPERPKIGWLPPYVDPDPMCFIGTGENMRKVRLSALSGAPQLTEHRGSMDDAPCPSS